jgi:hypothetical protein
VEYSGISRVRTCLLLKCKTIDDNFSLLYTVSLCARSESTSLETCPIAGALHWCTQQQRTGRENRRDNSLSSVAQRKARRILKNCPPDTYAMKKDLSSGAVAGRKKELRYWDAKSGQTTTGRMSRTPTYQIGTTSISQEEIPCKR